MKNIAVLGATGSIGKNSLDVIRSNIDCFNPVLFSANNNAQALHSLAIEFPNAKIALCESNKPAQNTVSGTVFGGINSSRIYLGSKRLLEAIAQCGADIVVNGIAGAAGLLPSLAALQSGANLALANKETIVMASSLVFKTARENDALVIPVDSEHSAIFNLINAHGRENVREIIITASGGPFKNYSAAQLKNVRFKDALAHPTWNMGAKITIDPASLANKGLEIIEAARLFDIAPDDIKVTVHPQSIVHSMVRLKNGAVFAECSMPDMRVPISDALFYPKVAESPFGLLDFDKLTLTFEKPDTERFPMLYFAYSALKKGACWTIAYNAANEEAVSAFALGKISFTDINNVCCQVLQDDFSGEPDTLEVILEADKKARQAAKKNISIIARKM
ncbi:MAG: 1-deoxy-D-xylulose-5-phosphate reductoisomerase [Termitinemataceae bacterium]|nr:MAG: 1-deoxy-D-xylulose-5-phosphate reductoisomerase [Termitinemataceae bacterium]